MKPVVVVNRGGTGWAVSLDILKSAADKGMVIVFDPLTHDFDKLSRPPYLGLQPELIEPVKQPPYWRRFEKKCKPPKKLL